MIEIKNGAYIKLDDIKEMSEIYTNGEWREDAAKYMINVLNVYEDACEKKTFAIMVEEMSRGHLTITNYEFLKDVIKVIDNDEFIDFSKYEYILDNTASCGGKKREPIICSNPRNLGREFSIIMKRVDVTGMLMIAKIIKELKHHQC